MLTLVIAIVLSFIAGALLNHFASKRAISAEIKSTKDQIDSEAWRDGFARGWEHAGMDYTYVRTRYEHFTNPQK